MDLDQFIRTMNERKKKPGTKSNGAVSLDAVVPAVPETGVQTMLSPSLGTDTKPTLKTTGRQALEQLKHRIHSLLVDKLNHDELKALSEERQRTELRRVLDGIIDAENYPFSYQQKKAFIEEVLDDVLGFGPLERLLRDPTVNDILINNAHCIYVERNGVLEEETDLNFRDNEQLLEIIQRIVSLVGRRVNESSPMVDARLPDGSRFNAIVPPLALDGPMVSIRRFGKRPLRIADLLAIKAFTPEMCRYMESAVKGHSVLVRQAGRETALHRVL